MYFDTNTIHTYWKLENLFWRHTLKTLQYTVLNVGKCNIFKKKTSWIKKKGINQKVNFHLPEDGLSIVWKFISRVISAENVKKPVGDVGEDLYTPKSHFLSVYT